MLSIASSGMKTSENYWASRLGRTSDGLKSLACWSCAHNFTVDRLSFTLVSVLVEAVVRVVFRRLFSLFYFEGLFISLRFATAAMSRHVMVLLFVLLDLPDLHLGNLSFGSDKPHTQDAILLSLCLRSADRMHGNTPTFFPLSCILGLSIPGHPPPLPPAAKPPYWLLIFFYLRQSLICSAAVLALSDSTAELARPAPLSLPSREARVPVRIR